jgi:hypothetical protein
MAGADIRYDMAAADAHPLVGRFAPDMVLHTASGTVRLAELQERAAAAAGPDRGRVACRSAVRVARPGGHRHRAPAGPRSCGHRPATPAGLLRGLGIGISPPGYYRAGNTPREHATVVQGGGARAHLTRKPEDTVRWHQQPVAGTRRQFRGPGRELSSWDSVAPLPVTTLSGVS